MPVFIVFFFPVKLPADAPDTAAPPATITSDELELLDNGAETFFRGHVVLIQEPYRLEADRMHQVKATGIVRADGHVRGAWISASGEKIVATGRHGRYNPNDQTSELWGRPEVTRWETERDTAPVVLKAVRIIADQREHAIWARGDVQIQQGKRLLVRSDEGRYVQTDQTIHFWGDQGVFVHVEDQRGAGDFRGDRGWVSLNPKEARLIDRVRGHVIPGSSL